MSTGQWVRYGEELVADIDRMEPPVGSLAIWYLGQESLVIKGAGAVVYLDPYFSDPMAKDNAGNLVPRRKFPPPFRGEDVRHADVVLGTHNHGDHIDVPTLISLAQSSPQARFVVPAPHVGVLTGAGIDAERVCAARARQVLQLRQLKVTPVPAAHEELERDAEGNFIALGYVVELNGVTLYHGGDTVEYPDLVETLRELRPDVVCLPINGRDLLRNRRNIIGNMSFREAADVGHAAEAKLIIPMHYDLFAGNSENPAFFADYLYRTYPSQPFKIMAPGERILYMP